MLTLPRGSAARRPPCRPVPVTTRYGTRGPHVQRRLYVLETHGRPGPHRSDRRCLRADAQPLPEPADVRLPGTRGPARYFVNYVKDQLVQRYGAGRVFGGGLRVRTTIDLALQEAARRAIEKVLPNPDGPAAALVAIDPSDGSVKAMFGGSSFRRSQFNLATQAERQPGSVVQADRAGGGLPPGDLAADGVRVEAGEDRRRRPDLVGAQLRGRLPGQGRPVAGDGAFRQLRLRAVDAARRTEADRRYRPQPRRRAARSTRTSRSASARSPSTRWT